jgi:hypothetical protein
MKRIGHTRIDRVLTDPMMFQPLWGDMGIIAKATLGVLLTVKQFCDANSLNQCWPVTRLLGLLRCLFYNTSLPHLPAELWVCILSYVIPSMPPRVAWAVMRQVEGWTRFKDREEFYWKLLEQGTVSVLGKRKIAPLVLQLRPPPQRNLQD